jgi:hypothetical protein
MIMSWLSDEIATAQRTLHIGEEAFRAVSPPDADHVVQAVRHQFLKYPERPSKFWWDQDLREQACCAILFNGPGLQQLAHVAPSAEEVVWLITNTEGAGEGEPIAVYEATVPAAQQILSEVRGHHEYYLASKQLTWLLCETHHGQIIAMGAPVVDRLQGYMRQHPDLVREAYVLPAGSSERTWSRWVLP